MLALPILYWPDDAFITFTHARNLAAGHGWAYYPGGPAVLGTSTPLFAAVLALAGRLGLDIVRTGLALSVVADVGIVVLIHRLGVRAASPAAALSAAFLHAISLSGISSSAGMEATSAAFAVLLLLLASLDGRLVLFAVAAVATCGLRPEMVLTPLAVHLWNGFRSDFSRRWRVVTLALAVALVAVSAGLVSEFGSIVPQTWQAKELFDRSFAYFPSLSDYTAQPALWPGLVMLPFGLWRVLSGRASSLLGVFAMAEAIRFGVLFSGRVPASMWMWPPFAVYLTLFFALGVAQVGDRIRSRSVRGAWWVVVTVAGATAAAPGLSGIRQMAAIEACTGDTDLRQHEALVLRRLASPHDCVAAYEVGKLAYYSETCVLDLLALTDPRALPFLESKDFGGYVRAARPRFVWLERAPGFAPAAFQTQTWFRAAYREVRSRPYPLHRNVDYVLWERRPSRAAR